MNGFVMTLEEKEPKWEETRTRIDDYCVKVSRKNVNAQTIIDPKGDYSLMEVFDFQRKGQLPYGEWLKKLVKTDIAPRGACARYFSENSRLRT